MEYDESRTDDSTDGLRNSNVEVVMGKMRESVKDGRNEIEINQRKGKWPVTSWKRLIYRLGFCMRLYMAVPFLGDHPLSRRLSLYKERNARRNTERTLPSTIPVQQKSDWAEHECPRRHLSNSKRWIRCPQPFMCIPCFLLYNNTPLTCHWIPHQIQKFQLFPRFPNMLYFQQRTDLVVPEGQDRQLRNVLCPIRCIHGSNMIPRDEQRS